MAKGQGKYDEMCEEILHRTHAKAVAIIVIDGDKGSGMSLNALHPRYALLIADTLEMVTDELIKEAKDDLEESKRG